MQNYVSVGNGFKRLVDAIIWHVFVDETGVMHVESVTKISIGLETLLTKGLVLITHDTPLEITFLGADFD
jgi:hypothetical protein